jgi:hypothetical protein
MIDIEVTFGFGAGPIRLGRCCIAGDKTQALALGVEAMAAEHPVHAVGRDPDPAPFDAPQLVGDVLGTGAGVGQSKAEDAHLDVGWGGIGHARASALTRPQELEAVPIRQALPAVVGRPVNTGVAAGC